VPCRINVFSGRKRERSPRENPPNGDFGGFSHDDLKFASPGKDTTNRGENAKDRHAKTRQMVILHGDLSPRQAKIRQTVDENATHGMPRTFVWRGERSPCENTKKSPFGGFSRGAFSPFRPEKAIIRHGTNQPPYYLDL